MSHLGAWSNEDDDFFVEVADEPDRDRAGQRLADQNRLAITFMTRTKIETQDCECVPTSDACPDDDDGKACVVRDDVDCWVFRSFDLGFGDMVDDLAEERRFRRERGKPFLLYLPAGVADPFADPAEPQPIAVAPGQVELPL